MADDKQSSLEARMETVIEGINEEVCGALAVCERYPRLEDPRSLSQWEDDLRSWGLLYGIAYGLARADSPDEANERVSERAYMVARLTYQKWSGQVQDPEQARQKALRDVVIAFDEATERAIQMSRYREGEMTPELRSALIELSTVVGVTA